MTRQEFIENVCDWFTLREFCDDENIYDCEDIYSSDEKDDDINNTIYEGVRHMDWRSLRNLLDDIEDGADYYRRNGSFDWDSLDDADFVEYKQEIIDRYDEQGDWEDEDEPEETTEEMVAGDEDIAENEEISFDELFESCNADFQNISNIAAEQTHEYEVNIPF